MEGAQEGSGLRYRQTKLCRGTLNHNCYLLWQIPNISLLFRKLLKY